MSQPSSPASNGSSTPSSLPALLPINRSLSNLVNTGHIYPTEYNLSYIQSQDGTLATVHGKEEVVKNFGIVDLQFPGQKLTLCGDGPTQNKVTGMDFFKEKLNSVYESAKKVEFKQEYPLPWEIAKQSKFLDSEMEIVEEKVRYLAMLQKLVYVKDAIINFDDKNEEHIRALPRFYEPKTIPKSNINNESIDVALAQQLAELHVLKVEKEFKKNLRRWMQGMGKLSEYPEDAINWAPSSIWSNMKQFNSVRSEDIKGLFKYFERNPRASQYLKKFSDAVHLRNVNPNIAQGFILEEDLLKWKTNTFLELLKKTPPKNDCEAYLFYKYLILKKEPNFDYIYDEKILEYLKEKEATALEAELEKIQKAEDEKIKVQNAEFQKK